MNITGVESLADLHLPCFVIQDGERIIINHQGCEDASKVIAYVPPLLPEQLGDADFKAFYGINNAYMAGAMANGIASEQLVIEMGRNKMLAAFGAGGLALDDVERAIQKIQQALPNGPYVFNFIHNPTEEAIERGTIDLYLKYGVNIIETAAFFNLTPSLVYYRAHGLSSDAQGNVQIANKIIAKVSRREVASVFMRPAPEKILQQLVAQGLISAEQAKLAAHVPMADDITVEADSGGHTDNRPLTVLLPSMIALRDGIQTQQQYPTLIRVGAGGGIGTPEAALAAFMMGAAYIVTGSINQACQEANASEHTKKLLAEAGMADVVMAPASDMFERGIELQVLKKGTMFPMRAKKLYELYSRYNSIDEIPAIERDRLEKLFFKDSLDNIWLQTVEFFQQRDADVIRRAESNPKKRMALVFRWYLGLSSRWSNAGVQGREFDYQIWCGPSMGAFNDWVRSTYLNNYKNRKVADVAQQLLVGAAYQQRIQTLIMQGIAIPFERHRYLPSEPLIKSG